MGCVYTDEKDDCKKYKNNGINFIFLEHQRVTLCYSGARRYDAARLETADEYDMARHLILLEQTLKKFSFVNNN